MNTAVTRLYSLLVALTLIGLLAWVGTDWYQIQEKSKALAHDKLRQTAGAVTDWAIHNPQADTARLPALLRSELLADSRWKMVLLTSPQRGTEYYWGPRSEGDLTKAVPAWSPRFPRELLTEVKVYTPDGKPWTLQAVFEFYGTTEILGLLRAAGLTLFILVLLTTLMVWLQARGPSARNEEVWQQPKPEEHRESAKPHAHAEEDDDEYWFDDTLSMEDLPPLETESASPQAPAMLAPSGLGWAHFVHDRLTFELDRCASNNQDLTLLLLGGQDLESESLYHALAGEVRTAFPSLDLDFEIRVDAASPAVAVVLPNRSLEQALAEAQNFLHRVDAVLPQLRLCAGASARSGRLLGATTLVKEAESALKRARQGSTRAVGLKTDPDRYREHLARSNPA